MRQTNDTKLIPILLRKPDEDNQFSWEDTFKAMAQEEDWRDLDVTLMDGLANDDA